MADFVASLERPRRVIIMVKAGGPTDAVISELVPLLEEGDIIIDAGNAHFPDTIRRENELKAQGLHFVGSGVSGGEEGALLRSLDHAGRVGEVVRVPRSAAGVDLGEGGRHSVLHLRRSRRRRAFREDGAQRHRVRRHAADRGGVRPDPAGHGQVGGEIADIFRSWNEGDLESFLIEITAEVLSQTGADGQPLVDVILDQAEQKGTGRWTVQNALDLGVPITGIAEATFARALSGSVPQREAARSVLPGTHRRSGRSRTADGFVEDVRQALYASKVVAYSQGFDQIAAASEEYGWNIDRGAMARIWRGGCIIRARFLNRITEAYERTPDLALLISDEYFTEAISTALPAWRRVVAGAAQNGIPTPAFSSSLAYYDGIRAERLPAALIQGQRDFFGAHTYHRIDKAGTFHTEWSGDRTESTLDAGEAQALPPEPAEKADPTPA